MKRLFLVAIATAVCCAFISCPTAPLHSQTAALTPSSAAQLLSHGGGVWVLESVGGQRIERDCLGKFTLQFKPAHQAESVGCHEGGTFSTSSEWRITTTSDHQIALNLGNETTSLDLVEHGTGPKRVYYLRLKLLSVLDPKSGNSSSTNIASKRVLRSRHSRGCSPPPANFSLFAVAAPLFSS